MNNNNKYEHSMFYTKAEGAWPQHFAQHEDQNLVLNNYVLRFIVAKQLKGF